MMMEDSKPDDSKVADSNIINVKNENASTSHDDDWEEVDVASEQNWKQMKETIFKKGYADGRDTGRGRCLQLTFDAGFKSCHTHLQRLHRIKGVLERCVIPHLKAREMDYSKVAVLVEEIIQVQESIKKDLEKNCSCHKNTETSEKTECDCPVTVIFENFLKEKLDTIQCTLKETGFESLCGLIHEFLST